MQIRPRTRTLNPRRALRGALYATLLVLSGCKSDSHGVTPESDAGPSEAGTRQRCGDGIIQGFEACDDGDTAAGDGCSTSCEVEPDFACQGAPSKCAALSGPPVCGDGKLSADEQCDDGNKTTKDGCAADCSVEAGYACLGAPSDCTLVEAPTDCGDGVFGQGEKCDDGNDANADGCSSSCQIEPGYACIGQPSVCAKFATGPECGDGALTADEECDDDGKAANDGCDANCQVEDGFTCLGAPSMCESLCGDGKVVGNEECDDNNRRDDGNGCSESCKRNNTCGNGVVESVFETCDDGVNDGSYGGCTADCQFADRCGDGQVDAAAGETCDDGNPDDTGNGCDAACHRNDVCGNNTVESLFEACDDGNAVDNGNGCSATCQKNNTCGNGTLESIFEKCDDGAANNDGAYGGCNANCELAPRCGDGTVQASEDEQCDDGNNVDTGNGCSATCKKNNDCGDGTLESAVEECDDGTANNNGVYGGCKADCTLASRCGDKTKDATENEECDDGNALNDHNGCDASCKCVNTCDAKCTDISNDPKNCGMCGTACTENQDCVGGVCCTNCNLLRGLINGSAAPGNATIVQIAGVSGATPYRTDLSATCSQQWFPTGTLCDEGGAGFTDSDSRSRRTSDNTGATWKTGGITSAYGALVVDLGALRTLSRFSIFQMFSDGKTHAVRFATHPAELGAPPPATDKGWVEITDWSNVDFGQRVEVNTNPAPPNPDYAYVTSPAKVTLDQPVTTRFLRIDARAPGEDFIELRSVKAFRR